MLPQAICPSILKMSGADAVSVSQDRKRLHMKERRTLLIEGWRFIPHSYAVVNQFQCLEMLRRPEVRLLHRDMPYHRDYWRPVSGCLDPQSEALLRAIPAPTENDRIDAIYRITFPYNLSPASVPRCCVFGTAEFGYVPPRFIAGQHPLAQALAMSNSMIVTPSNWSRDGFLGSGADASRVAVIPLGFDPQIFHPLANEARQALRRQAGWDGFWFLSLGTMTGNKGVKLLLKAFAAVAARHPQVKLCLKGLDSLYGSKQMLEQQLDELTPAEVALIEPRCHYLGGTMSFRDVAMLYQMADAYVAPYCAEGFALPVLEAIACGCPVICTAGGPTDDFTTTDFALRINSHVESTPEADGSNRRLVIPHPDSLLRHMLTVVEQPAFVTHARLAGLQFVKRGFTWKSVVDRMLALLFAA